MSLPAGTRGGSAPDDGVSRVTIKLPKHYTNVSDSDVEGEPGILVLPSSPNGPTHQPSFYSHGTLLRLHTQQFIDGLRGKPCEKECVPYLKNESMFSQSDYGNPSKLFNTNYRTRTGPTYSQYNMWKPVCSVQEMMNLAEDLWGYRKTLQGYVRGIWSIEKQLAEYKGTSETNTDLQRPRNRRIGPSQVAEISQTIDQSLNAAITNPASAHEAHLLYASRSSPNFLASILMELPDESSLPNIVPRFAAFVVKRLYQTGTTRCEELCAEFVRDAVINCKRKRTVATVIRKYVKRPEHGLSLRRLWRNPIGGVHNEIKRGDGMDAAVFNGRLIKDVSKFCQLLVDPRTPVKLPTGIAIVAHTIDCSPMFSKTSAAEFLFESYAVKILETKVFTPHVYVEDSPSKQTFHHNERSLRLSKNYFEMCAKIVSLVLASNINEDKARQAIIAICTSHSSASTEEKDRAAAKIFNAVFRLRSTLSQPCADFVRAVVKLGANRPTTRNLVSEIGTEIGGKDIDIMIATDSELREFVQCLQVVPPPTGREFPNPYEFPLRSVEPGGVPRCVCTFAFDSKPLHLSGNYRLRLNKIEKNLRNLFLALADHDKGADEEIASIMTALNVEQTFIRAVNMDFDALQQMVAKVKTNMLHTLDHHEGARRRLLHLRPMSTSARRGTYFGMYTSVEAQERGNNVLQEKTLEIEEMQMRLRGGQEAEHRAFSPHPVRLKMNVASPVYSKRYEWMQGRKDETSSPKPAWNRLDKKSFEKNPFDNGAKLSLQGWPGTKLVAATTRVADKLRSGNAQKNILSKTYDAAYARDLRAKSARVHHSSRPAGWVSAKASERIKKIKDLKEDEFQKHCSFQPNMEATRRHQHMLMGLSDKQFPTKTYAFPENRGTRLITKQRMRRESTNPGPKSPARHTIPGVGFGSRSPRPFSLKVDQTPQSISANTSINTQSSTHDHTAPIVEDNEFDEGDFFADCEEEDGVVAPRNSMNHVMFPVPILTRTKFLKVYQTMLNWTAKLWGDFPGIILDEEAVSCLKQRRLTCLQFLHALGANPDIAASFNFEPVTESIPETHIKVKLSGNNTDIITAHFRFDLSTLVSRFCITHSLDPEHYFPLLMNQILSHLLEDFPNNNSRFCLFVRALIEFMQNDFKRAFTFDEFVSYLDLCHVFLEDLNEVGLASPTRMSMAQENHEQMLNKMHHGGQFLMFHVQNGRAACTPFEIRLSNNNARLSKSRRDMNSYAPVHLLSIADIEHVEPLLPRKLASALTAGPSRYLKLWLCFTVTVGDYLIGKSKSFYFQAEDTDTLSRWVEGMRYLTDSIRKKTLSQSLEKRESVVSSKGNFLWARVRQRVKCDATMRRASMSNVVVDAMLAGDLIRTENERASNAEKVAEYLDRYKDEIPSQTNGANFSRIIKHGDLMKKGRGGGFFNLRRNWKKRNIIVSVCIPSDAPEEIAKMNPFGELNYFHNGVLRGTVRIDSETIILRDNEDPDLRFSIQRNPHAEPREEGLRYDISLRGETKAEISSWRRAIRHVMKISRLYSPAAI